MTMTPAQVRARIAEARRDAAKHEATAEAQEKELAADKKKLQKLLKCKPGKEKAAIKSLQARVKKNQAEVERLLAEADEIESVD